MAHRLDLEMALSPEEFRRLLLGAVGSPFVEGPDGVYLGGEAPRRWTLRLVELPDFRSGRLSLSRHRVELRLEGYAPAEAEAFLARFHRGFLRGGG